MEFLPLRMVLSIIEFYDFFSSNPSRMQGVRYSELDPASGVLVEEIVRIVEVI